jgi:serine phosphatase RsbU (regulator of sigma subunit)
MARDGLQGTEFSQGAYYRSADGTMYFGGTNGASVFDPAKVHPSTYSPPVVLTSVRVFGEPRTIPKEGLDLSYRDSAVTFGFAALAFEDPQKTQYEYTLAGQDDRWIATHANAINFTLQPGDYTFRLRARAANGAPSANVLAIPIHVAPPPWRTWWAYTLYGLALLGLLLAFVRYQRRKITLLEQRNRLSTVERELQLTAAVQTGFLPEANIVKAPGFGLVGVYRPAGQCSGDWWWHEPLNGADHLIAVGDVTGHGPGPAMVTAAVSTTFRVMRDVWEKSGPAEFLRVANDQVMKSGRGKYFMQMMVAGLDTRTGKLSLYSAAGYPVVCILSGKVRVCGGPSVPLGTADFHSTEQSVMLSPGDRFMLLTDGVPEIELHNGRRLGIRRLNQIFYETLNMPIDTAAAHILEAADAANQGRTQEDDWTFVVAEWATD